MLGTITNTDGEWDVDVLVPTIKKVCNACNSCGSCPLDVKATKTCYIYSCMEIGIHDLTNDHYSERQGIGNMFRVYIENKKIKRIFNEFL